MAPTSRFSARRPLVGALLFSMVVGILYGLGYRGKYQFSESPLEIENIARLVVPIFLLTFIFFYILQMLGVKIRFGGSRERRAREDE